MKRINGHRLLTLGLSALVMAAMVACNGATGETTEIESGKGLQLGGKATGKDCITIIGGAPEDSKVDTLLDCGDTDVGDGADSTSVSNSNLGSVGVGLPGGKGGVDTTDDCGSSKDSNGNGGNGCGDDSDGPVGDDAPEAGQGA